MRVPHVFPSVSVFAPALALAAALALGCDRKVEPFVPGEQPSPPDLARIFPPGAEKTRETPGAPGAMPPAPGEAPAGQRGGAPPPAPRAPGDGAAPASAAASGPPIRGTVQIPAELVSRVTPQSVVFVIARAGAGGPPTAVKRIAAPRFPLDFEIGPGDRMIESMPFAGPFQISARLDGDGNATTRSPGDVQGAAAAPAQPGDAGVSIVLDEPL